MGRLKTNFDMESYDDSTLADRQFFRDGPSLADDSIISDKIREFVARFPNVTVRGGCIPTKIRPNPLYLEFALKRIIQRRPLREIAAESGRSARYVRYAVQRGRAMLDGMGFEGVRTARPQRPG